MVDVVMEANATDASDRTSPTSCSDWVEKDMHSK